MLNIAELNALTSDEFVRVVGPVFEHSPWIASRAAARLPFATAAELRDTLFAIVRSAALEEKLSLIRAHPDLVGNATLTRESQHEQQSAGLSGLNPDEVDRFRRYNEQYRKRFDFPFVICARLNKKDAILQAFPERLQNSRDKEIETGVEEILNIADLRLRDLIA
jgi:2-oxo-4-hydroxy-4-carboxy-5-ureidoimidazoline decarboxylase